MIQSIKVAYKIGFSAAIGSDPMGMLAERSKWDFKMGRVNKELLKAFRRGYYAGVLECENIKENV